MQRVGEGCAHPGVRGVEKVEAEEVTGVEDVEVAVTRRRRWSARADLGVPFLREVDEGVEEEEEATFPCSSDVELHHGDGDEGVDVEVVSGEGFLERAERVLRWRRLLWRKGR